MIYTVNLTYNGITYETIGEMIIALYKENKTRQEIMNILFAKGVDYIDADHILSYFDIL